MTRRRSGRKRIGRIRHQKAKSETSLIDEFESWLVESEGVSRADAKAYAEAVLDFQRSIGVSDSDFDAMPREEIAACIAMLDRELEKLDKEELEKPDAKEPTD